MSVLFVSSVHSFLPNVPFEGREKTFRPLREARPNSIFKIIRVMKLNITYFESQLLEKNTMLSKPHKQCCQPHQKRCWNIALIHHPNLLLGETKKMPRVGSFFSFFLYSKTYFIKKRRLWRLSVSSILWQTEYWLIHSWHKRTDSICIRITGFKINISINFQHVWCFKLENK